MSMSKSTLTYPPSDEVISRLELLEHWSDAFLFIKDHPESWDWVLNYIPHSAFTCTLVSELFLAGIIDKHEFRGLMLNFNKDRPHAMEIPDGFEKLPKISDELFAEISSLRTSYELLDFISENPDEFPYAMVYCNHSCYNRELVEGLVKLGFKTPEEAEYTIKYTLQCARPGEFDTHTQEELRLKVKSITNWRHIYNLMSEHPSIADRILFWTDPKICNNELYKHLCFLMKDHEDS